MSIKAPGVRRLARGSPARVLVSKEIKLINGEIAKAVIPTITPCKRRRDGALYEASMPPQKKEKADAQTTTTTGRDVEAIPEPKKN